MRISEGRLKSPLKDGTLKSSHLTSKIEANKEDKTMYFATVKKTKER